MSALKTQDQGTIALSQHDYLPIVVDSFLVARRAQGLSPETISLDRKQLKYLRDYCEDQASPGNDRRRLSLELLQQQQL